MLALKGVGATVVSRLEQIGFSSLSQLVEEDPRDVTLQISQLMGSICWHNSPQARGAIQAVIDLARGENSMQLHLIFTETQVLLSNKHYATWREIQDEHADYTTSLGPWSTQQVLDFITTEYPDLSPPASEQVALALTSGTGVVALTFAVRPA